MPKWKVAFDLFSILSRNPAVSKKKSAGMREPTVEKLKYILLKEVVDAHKSGAQNT
jgi:hypothetical protein